MSLQPDNFKWAFALLHGFCQRAEPPAPLDCINLVEKFHRVFCDEPPPARGRISTVLTAKLDGWGALAILRNIGMLLREDEELDLLYAVALVFALATSVYPVSNIQALNVVELMVARWHNLPHGQINAAHEAREMATILDTPTTNGQAPLDDGGAGEDT